MLRIVIGSRPSPAVLAAAFPQKADDRASRETIDLGNYELLTADDLKLPAFDPIRAGIDMPGGHDRSADVACLARDMVRDPRGFTDAQIVGVLMNSVNAISEHILEQRHPLRAATRALAFARAQAAKDGGEGAGDRGAGSNDGGSSDRAAGPRGPNDAAPFSLIEAADWDGKPVPPREYVINGMVPAHIVAMATGDGGVGKSLLLQGAATAVALGARFVGFATAQRNAAYLTAEDDERELQERQVAICGMMKVSLSSLRGKLFISSLLDVAEKAVMRVGRNHQLLPTVLLDHVRDTITKHALGFLVLDNVGHFFGGDEIVRDHVVTFLSHLNKLARDTQCTIVLIAHPNKSGATYSGSTAWRNQVRLQLHLAKVDDAAGDPNVRELTLEKANYAPPGETIRLAWHRGAFWRESDVPEDDNSRFNSLKRAQNDIFFVCLAKQTLQQSPVSKSKTAGNYAPRVFASMPDAKGMKVDEFERTMTRLFGEGLIEVGELPFKRSDRHKQTGIRRASQTEVDDEPY